MRKVLIDLTQVNKLENGNYIFDTHYRTEMDEEEYKKIIGNFKNQIKTADKTIESNDPEKLVAKEIERLKNDLKAKKEALKNFDKMFDEEMENMEKLREQKKLELKESIDNHLKIKEMMIANIRHRGNNYLDNFKFQREQDTKLLDLYENLGEIDETKKESNKA